MKQQPVEEMTTESQLQELIESHQRLALFYQEQLDKHLERTFIKEIYERRRNGRGFFDEAMDACGLTAYKERRRASQ